MPQFSVFTTTAPSMPAGGHEMRENFSNHDPPRSLPYTAPSVTPYLGLRSRLSQVWLNRWTILLLIVLARVLIACSSVNDNLASARAQALSSCSSVESMGSAMVSMPHYMALGTNQIVSDSANKAVDVARESAVAVVNAMEDIVFFIIHILTAYRLCVMEFVAGGSTAVAVDILNNAQTSLDGVTKSIGDDIGNVASTFVNAYNTARNTLNGVTIGIGGSTVLPPPIDLGSNIDKIRNLKLPSDLADKIKQFNATVFNLADQAGNFTETTIRDQFQKLKSGISSNFDSVNFTVGQFPVPEKQRMNFCTTDNPVNGFFDHLDTLVATAIKVFIAVLLLAAILACVPMAYHEIRRWRKIRARAQIVGSGEHDPLDVVYIVSRPYTSSAGLKVSGTFKSTRRQALVRWVIAYATSPAALFVLALAIAGLFSCLCHYILIKSIEKEVPALTNQVTGFADKVMGKLDDISVDWANDVNDILTKANTTINQRLGQLANDTEDLFNLGIPSLFDDTIKTINDTFSQSLAAQALERFVQCLIDLKTATIRELIQKAENRTQVFITLVQNDTFSKGPLASIAKDQAADQSFLATQGDVATDKISNVVAKVVNAMLSQLRTEVAISACILGIYGIVVLSAVIRAATLWNGHDKVRGEGGAAPNPSDARTPNMDFRSNNQDRFGHTNLDLAEPVHYQNGINTPYAGPAPRYSTAIEEKAMQQRAENPFGDAKRSLHNGDSDSDRDHRF